MHTLHTVDGRAASLTSVTARLPQTLSGILTKPSINAKQQSTLTPFSRWGHSYGRISSSFPYSCLSAHPAAPDAGGEGAVAAATIAFHVSVRKDCAALLSTSMNYGAQNKGIKDGMVLSFK